MKAKLKTNNHQTSALPSYTYAACEKRQHGVNILVVSGGFVEKLTTNTRYQRRECKQLKSYLAIYPKRI